MEEHAGSPGDVTIVQTRVYYDPDSGDIIHIHRLAVPEGETLDKERIEEEMSAFDGSIEQRHGRALASTDVEANTFDEAGGGTERFRIDVQSKAVIREDPEEGG